MKIIGAILMYLFFPIWGFVGTVSMGWYLGKGLAEIILEEIKEEGITETASSTEWSAN